MKKQIISFLESFIVVWDFASELDTEEVSTLPALSLVYRSFCSLNGLPTDMSADELLGEYLQYTDHLKGYAETSQKPSFEYWKTYYK